MSHNARPVLVFSAAMLKHGMSCISTWKAYAPYTLAGTWSESSDDISGKIIAVRKSGIPASKSASWLSAHSMVL